jgi:hypothetical protein
MAKNTPLATAQQIEDALILLRGEKVLLDSDLADFYGVSTKALNQAVKRNQGAIRKTSCFASPPRKRPN